jgi:hypothetical protein
MRLFSGTCSLPTVSVVGSPLLVRPPFSCPVPGVKLKLWRQSCDRILEPLEDLSQRLLDNFKMSHQNGDKSGAGVAGSSCIACLAHLAVLYEVIGRTDSVATTEMSNRCDSALRRLGTLTSQLPFDEYNHLDLLLGVRSFLSASRTIAHMGLNRIHGRNHWLSSMHVWKASPSKRASCYDVFGRS